MASHESIRPEASTVHRRPDAGADHDGSSAPPKDELQLVQAKTVIRGSSRAEGSAKRSDQVERSPAVVAKVLLGTRLNHFFLEELIGGGGMGAVFRARDEQLDRVVAIKVIPFVGEDPDLQRRFRNEAQSAAKLDHPRIARVFDVGSHDEWHYIVFEYIHGTNVRDLVLGGGVLSIDDAVFYTCQIADAIQHAADRGIVHRDIKPSNVLIGAEDTIKLVDMGLARSEHFELSEDMTASGVTLGTFDYISPEQARDPRDADLRSDIYSLGCTLYFMLTGRPPYPGGTVLQKLLSHGNAPPPDVRELRQEVSAELTAVIQKMLAKSPGDRYQSASDLIADLREVAFLDGLERTQAVGPIAIREPNPVVIWMERHAPWLVAVTLLLVTVGWLHLNAVASREDVTVPNSALPPVLVQLTDPATSIPDGAGEPSGQDDERLGGPASTLPPPTTNGQTANGQTANGQTANGQTADGQAADEQRASAGDQNSPPDDASPRLPESFDQGEPVSDPVRPATESDNGSSSAVDAEGALAPPWLIRIKSADSSPEKVRDTDGAALAYSLADALQLAARFEVDRIEISVPVIYSQPVTISRDGLRITSNVAGGSAIVFRQQESAPTTNMVSIGSNRIEFEDVHFVWQVPQGWVGGGALFGINDNRWVRLNDCSITVDNPGRGDAIYAFDVVTQSADSRQPNRLSGVEEGALPAVAIELNSVIVRGHMSMIHMDDAAALRLNWDNGLLVITDRMIDTAGALVQPETGAPPIQLVLTRLTAHVPAGLLRMRVDGRYPLAVNRFAESSVFVVDSGTPHFEFQGLSTLPSGVDLLKIHGMSNVYETDPTLSDPLLVLSDLEGQSFGMPLNRLVQTFADELSPRWSVSWAQVRRSDAPASRRTLQQYLQDGPEQSGFDAKLLPILPALESAVSAAPRVSRLDAKPAI
jgi:serine/threonine-protein kinase